jgi:hypothetical protein
MGITVFSVMLRIEKYMCLMFYLFLESFILFIFYFLIDAAYQ